MRRRTKENVLLICALCIICVITVFWCIKKSDMFIDEIYSYGLSNSYYAPFIKDTTKSDTLINTIFFREDFVDYMSVGEEERFSFGSVYYNQTQDVHPPLYYMILHCMCSFFVGSYSKWIGLSINILLYIATCILIYKVGTKILDKKISAILAVLIYGTSYGGLSTVLMIRMYMLLAFFTVLFFWIVLCLHQESAGNIYYILLLVILYLGLLTQYFFAIFAFFISAVFCLWELKEKRIKKCTSYALFAFAGVAAFFFSYPYMIEHLSADKLVSGKTAVDNMIDIRGMMLSLYSFVMQTLVSFKPILYGSIIIFTVKSLFQRKWLIEYITNFNIQNFPAVLMIITTILTLGLTAVVSPYTALRYVYNVLPFVAIGIVYFVEPVWRNSEKCLYICIGACMILCVVQSLKNVPSYVETMPNERFQMAEQYRDLPCVFLSENDYRPISRNMILLMRFSEIFVTNDFVSANTQKYLKDKSIDEGIILFISSTISNDDRNEQEILGLIEKETGYQSKLLSKDFDDMYLLY